MSIRMIGFGDVLIAVAQHLQLSPPTLIVEKYAGGHLGERLGSSKGYTNLRWLPCSNQTDTYIVVSPIEKTGYEVLNVTVDIEHWTVGGANTNTVPTVAVKLPLPYTFRIYLNLLPLIDYRKFSTGFDRYDFIAIAKNPQTMHTHVCWPFRRGCRAVIGLS